MKALWYDMDIGKAVALQVGKLFTRNAAFSPISPFHYGGDPGARDPESAVAQGEEHSLRAVRLRRPICENAGLLPLACEHPGAGFSPFMVMHRSQPFRIPPALTDDQAALLEPTS